MSKTLIMRFRTATGKEVRLNILNPKDSLNASDVSNLGTTIAQKNIFTTKSGDMVQFLGAVLDEKNSTTIV